MLNRNQRHDFVMAHCDFGSYWNGMGCDARSYVVCRHHLDKPVIEKTWTELSLEDQQTIREALGWEIGVMC